MNKNTKMILGVGALAIVGYLVWKQMSKPKAAFANLTAAAPGCPCGQAAPAGDQTMPGWTVCAGKNDQGEYDKACRNPKTKTGSFVGR
jgi:hypothetical protein